MAGFALVGFAVGELARAQLERGQAMRRFESAVAASPVERPRPTPSADIDYGGPAANSEEPPPAAPAPAGGNASATGPDQSLWSAFRRDRFRGSADDGSRVPLALLRIPSVGIEVPVHDGTDEWALTRGAGRIRGTARPGDGGHLGIASHRDGFFRGLKDIEVGDRIELETARGPESYVVRSLSIVEPHDVDVLAPSAEPVLTLVTCYPFYFVGRAPQRFIVRAEPA